MFVKLAEMSTSQQSIDKVIKRLIKLRQQAELDQLDAKIEANEKKRQVNDVRQHGATYFKAVQQQESLSEIESTTTTIADDSIRDKHAAIGFPYYRTTGGASGVELCVMTPSVAFVTQNAPISSNWTAGASSDSPSSITNRTSRHFDYTLCLAINKQTHQQTQPHQQRESNNDKLQTDHSSCLIDVNDATSCQHAIDVAVEQSATNDMVAVKQQERTPNDEAQLTAAKDSNDHETRPEQTRDSVETPNSPTTTCSSRDTIAKKPSSEMLTRWKQSLPLQTVLRTIEVLMPQIEQSKQSSSLLDNEPEMIKFLQNGTLVGLLPVPHPITIRKFVVECADARVWLIVCVWASTYVKHSTWDGTKVKLIKLI